jgi:hypothetical protein
MTHVFITWKIKKGDIRQSAEVEFGQDRLQISDKQQNLATLLYSNKVVAHLCNYTCTLKKIEVRLKKEADNINWVNLERGSGEQVPKVASVAAPTINSAPLSYPSSSKNKKNWDKVEKEASKELSDKPEGDSALNDLFK